MNLLSLILMHSLYPCQQRDCIKKGLQKECRLRIGFQAMNCSCFSTGFVLHESLKSSNSLRIGPGPKMISNGFPLSKPEKSYGSFNAVQFKTSTCLQEKDKDKGQMSDVSCQ